ncbi:MAG: lysylphosphatidylglycerol synthase domain-containing protein [Candidatus Sulfobium sp.]
MAPGTRKILFFIVKVVVSAAALYAVFSGIDVREFALMLAKIGPLYFVLAALPYVMAQAVSTLRWKLLLPGSLTLASVFMDRYFGFLSLMTIGISAFPFAAGYFGKTVYKWLMPLIFVTFVVASILFFRLQLGKKFGSIGEIYDYFGRLKSRKDVIVKAVLLSLVVQLLNFFMVIILALAMGEDIPMVLLFVFLPIIISVSTIPISVSGLGVREGSFVLLLGLIGVSPAVATSLSLSWFFANFLGGLPGLVLYVRRTGMSEGL